MRGWMQAAAVTVILTLGGGVSVAGAAMPDPAAPGPLSVRHIDYDAGHITATDPKDGKSYSARLRGRLYVPGGSAAGPVVLIVHGGSANCFVGSQQLDANPCPPTPISGDPHYELGFGYLGDNLASHGITAVAVNVEDVDAADDNGPDIGIDGRAQVIAATLDRLASWNHESGPAPVGNALVGRIDMSRIGLWGHSRGGEGVTRFMEEDRARYPGLNAVLAAAPADYLAETPTGTNFATISPLCDGILTDLQGRFAWDRGLLADPRDRAARILFTLRGASHLFFADYGDGYDSGDDFTGDDSACNRKSPTTDRMAPPDQRKVVLALSAAFFRYYLDSDRRFGPLLTGAAGLPPAACPARPACQRALMTTYVGPGTTRRELLGPSRPPHRLDRAAGGAPLRTRGFTKFASCTPRPDSGSDVERHDPGTHSGCPTNPNRSRVPQLTLVWDHRATLRVGLAPHNRDLHRFRSLTFRVGVNFRDPRTPKAGPLAFAVSLVDRRGRRRSVDAARYGTALEPPEGTSFRQVTLNAVRIPLAAFKGVDHRHLRALELRFGRRHLSRRGSLQLANLYVQEPVIR